MTASILGSKKKAKLKFWNIYKIIMKYIMYLKILNNLKELGPKPQS